MDKCRHVNIGLPVQTRETASKMVVGFIRACLSFHPLLMIRSTLSPAVSISELELPAKETL